MSQIHQYQALDGDNTSSRDLSQQNLVQQDQVAYKVQSLVEKYGRQIAIEQLINSLHGDDSMLSLEQQQDGDSKDNSDDRLESTIIEQLKLLAEEQLSSTDFSSGVQESIYSGSLAGDMSVVIDEDDQLAYFDQRQTLTFVLETLIKSNCRQDCIAGEFYSIAQAHKSEEIYMDIVSDMVIDWRFDLSQDLELQSIEPLLMTLLIDHNVNAFKVYQNPMTSETLEQLLLAVDCRMIDLNLAVSACKVVGCGEALIYLETLGLMDSIQPLLRWLKQIQSALKSHHPADQRERHQSPLYKVYVYVTNILNGQLYPQGIFYRSIPQFDILQCQLANFLFSRSYVGWPNPQTKIILSDKVKLYPYLVPLICYDPQEFFKMMTTLFSGDCFDQESTPLSGSSNSGLTLYIDRQFVMMGIMAAFENNSLLQVDDVLFHFNGWLLRIADLYKQDVSISIEVLLRTLNDMIEFMSSDTMNSDNQAGLINIPLVEQSLLSGLKVLSSDIDRATTELMLKTANEYHMDRLLERIYLQQNNALKLIDIWISRERINQSGDVWRKLSAVLQSPILKSDQKKQMLQQLKSQYLDTLAGINMLKFYYFFKEELEFSSQQVLDCLKTQELKMKFLRTLYDTDFDTFESIIYEDDDYMEQFIRFISQKDVDFAVDYLGDQRIQVDGITIDILIRNSLPIKLLWIACCRCYKQESFLQHVVQIFSKVVQELNSEHQSATEEIIVSQCLDVTSQFLDVLSGDANSLASIIQVEDIRLISSLIQILIVSERGTSSSFDQSADMNSHNQFDCVTADESESTYKQESLKNQVKSIILKIADLASCSEVVLNEILQSDIKYYQFRDLVQSLLNMSVKQDRIVRDYLAIQNLDSKSIVIRYAQCQDQGSVAQQLYRCLLCKNTASTVPQYNLSISNKDVVINQSFKVNSNEVIVLKCGHFVHGVCLTRYQVTTLQCFHCQRSALNDIEVLTRHDKGKQKVVTVEDSDMDQTTQKLLQDQYLYAAYASSRNY
ncbi:hypothetical protein MIR68_010317 [Amoeboaphelidium protococcarum]|nr:hypothetical protein MIR68_010317 [Amoeboaphelidium protococcarum]